MPAAGAAFAALLIGSCSTDPLGPSTTLADEYPAPTRRATSTATKDGDDRASGPRKTAPDATIGEHGPETSTPPNASGDDAIRRARRELPRSVAVEAENAATAFVRAWTRKDLDADRWWDGVRSSFTPDAARVYRYVDPAAVPGTTVTATGDLHEESTRYLALVSVPTDAGAYEVRLLHLDGAWLVDRADPP